MPYDPVEERTSDLMDGAGVRRYRWLKTLWLMETARLLASGASYFPPLNGPARWGIQVLAVAGVICLYCLGPVCPRYRRAGLLRGAVVLAQPLLGMLPAGQMPAMLLMVLGMACDLAATYQEFRGHAAITFEKDRNLAGNWIRLLWVTLLAGGLQSGETLLMNIWFFKGNLPLLAAAEPFRRTWTVVMGAAGFLLRMAYLWYLYRTVRNVKTPD